VVGERDGDGDLRCDSKTSCAFDEAPIVAKGFSFSDLGEGIGTSLGELKEACLFE